MELSKEIIERFLAVDPATVGHYIGGGFMRPEMKPVKRDDTRMVGPAYTVRISGRDSCELYYAIYDAPKGSVIVVDRCGDDTFACCGEMVVRFAMSRGMAGIVVDGPATDSRAIEKLSFPVFCTGISAVTTVVWGVSGETNIPVCCSGAIVTPGDIVFGDADGVVVLPPDNFEIALRKAEESVAKEIGQRKVFEEGGMPGWNMIKLHNADIQQIIAEFKKYE